MFVHNVYVKMVIVVKLNIDNLLVLMDSMLMISSGT